MTNHVSEAKHAAQARQIMKTLDRGLALLDVVRQAPSPLTLSELLELFPTDSGTLHRLLTTLVRAKYLVQHYRSKRYSVGPKSVMLNRAFYLQNRIHTTTTGLMQTLSAQFPEAVAVVCVNSGQNMAIIVQEWEKGLSVLGESVGMELPLHSTAHGKALIAWQPPEIQNAYFATHPVCSTCTPAILEAIRTCGWAAESEEYESERWGLAMPVLDSIGRAVASAGFCWHTLALESRSAEMLNALGNAVQSINYLVRQHA
jgi:DNA-binding IclR family transcriptional regulator